MKECVSSEALVQARQRDQRANARLLRGLAFLEENTPASLREAVVCFDAAIGLRRQLPLAENCWFRYGLIAGWMNRGDALTRLGSADELRDALSSYDEALTHLRELPMNESPLFIKRLAIAWLNRGITLLKQATPGSVAQAVQSFREAISAAQNFHSANSVEGTVLLAGAWMNHANALVQLSPPEVGEARNATNEALKLCRPTEQNDPSVAEIGFKARHILCQALAHLLAGHEMPSTQRDELLIEATEAVDEGLALARHWEARGAVQFRSQAADLFRFGCRVYQTHQPHFLTEFLLENLDPARSDGAFADDLQIQASAMDALWRSLGELLGDGFKVFNTPRFEQVLVQLQELRITGDRLAELRRQCRACGPSRVPEI